MATEDDDWIVVNAADMARAPETAPTPPASWWPRFSLASLIPSLSLMSTSRPPATASDQRQAATFADASGATSPTSTASSFALADHNEQATTILNDDPLLAQLAPSLSPSFTPVQTPREPVAVVATAVERSNAGDTADAAPAAPQGEFMALALRADLGGLTLQQQRVHAAIESQTSKLARAGGDAETCKQSEAAQQLAKALTLQAHNSSARTQAHHHRRTYSAQRKR